jgi:UMF1 family MFS transporter
VAMNSYLPSLAKEAPEVVVMRETLQSLKNETLDGVDGEANVDDLASDQAEAEHAALLLSTDSSTTGSSPASKLATLTGQYETLLSQTIARVSSFGIALGYCAGIILLLFTLIPVNMLHGSTWSLRLAIGLSGLWWGLGCIPVVMWLPHGSFEAHVEQDGEWPADERLDKSWNIYAEVKSAWMKLGAMLRWTEIRKLKNTFQFLAAWFLLSDGSFDRIDPRLCNS